MYSDSCPGCEPDERGLHKEFDVVGAIMEFEQGSMLDDDIIVLFQHLVDTGMAWSLQGSYGRMARTLIENGAIHK